MQPILIFVVKGTIITTTKIMQLFSTLIFKSHKHETHRKT